MRVCLIKASSDRNITTSPTPVLLIDEEERAFFLLDQSEIYTHVKGATKKLLIEAFEDDTLRVIQLTPDDMSGGWAALDESTIKSFPISESDLLERMKDILNPKEKGKELVGN